MRFAKGLMLAACLAVGTAQAREVPVGDFFKDPEFSSIALSPDGRHMAVTVPQQDRTVLAVLTTADKKIVGKWDYGANRHFRDVIWANNERLLFFVGFKTGEFDFEVGKPDLYASNIDGTKRIDIPNGNTYSIVDLTPADPKTILVSRSVQNAYLSKLNVYTGDVDTLAVAPVQGGTFLVDHDGRVRYSFGVMDDGRNVTYRRDGETWTLVHESPRGGASLRPLRFSEDNRRVYFLKGDNGKPESVVLMDPATREELPLSSNGIVSPNDFLWSSDRKTLLAVEYADGVPYWDFVAPDHPETKVYAGLAKAFPGKAVDFFDVTEDGRYIAVRVYSDRDPGRAFLFDRESSQARFMAASMDWIKPEEMSESKPVSVSTRDGVVIHGYLTLPAGKAPKGLPLIILPHGGPHGPRDYWRFNPEVQFLANRGYAVMQMNYRGSGGYGNAFERLGYRKWGTAMQDDLTDSVRWAVREGYADADRLCIYGASYGGYAALMSAVREPDLYKCAVGYVGVYDLAIQQRDSDTADYRGGRSYLRDVFPPTVAERQAHSPLYGVDRIKAAVMLVHGAMDQRVPVKNMHELIAAMKKVGKAPEDVVVEEKEGHGFFDYQNQVDLYTRMEAFFNRHIGKR